MERFNKLYADAQNMNVEKPIVSEEQAILFENKFKEILKAYGIDVKDDAATDEQMKALYEALGLPYISGPGENVLWKPPSAIEDATTGNHYYGYSGLPEDSGILGAANIWERLYGEAGVAPPVTTETVKGQMPNVDQAKAAGAVVTANISINGLMYKDSEELAEEVVGKIQQMIDGKEAAYD
jgi:hypothetical protein